MGKGVEFSKLFRVLIFPRGLGVQELFDSLIQVISVQKGIPVQKNEKTGWDNTSGASAGDPSGNHSGELSVYDLVWVILR